MGCLLSTGHLITSCLQESVNSRWFYAYLMGVAAQVKRSYQVPLVLIVDNASIHRSKQMVDWRKLLVQEYSTTLYFLPAYSPELNRIEMVWKQMKYNWRDFKVMKADQIERWVGQISKGFGNEYMFTFQLILTLLSVIPLIVSADIDSLNNVLRNVLDVIPLWLLILSIFIAILIQYLILKFSFGYFANKIVKNMK